MVDTCEIGHTLVPSTKRKSDPWKHFNLCKRKRDGRIYVCVAVCKQCNSAVKLVGHTLNVSMHMKRRHHHLSLNREDRSGITDNFATSFLHFPLFFTALWDVANSRPVHSLMLSSHLFLCLNRYHPLYLLGSPVGNLPRADKLARISQYTDIFRCLHNWPVCVLVQCL